MRIAKLCCSYCVRLVFFSFVRFTDYISRYLRACALPQGNEVGEMQLIKDEVVVVAKQDDDAWWTGYGRNGRSGCFPASHVALLPQVAHGGSYMLAEHDHKVSPQRRASSAQFARVLTFNLHCRCVPCDRSLFTRRRPRTIPNLISNEATSWPWHLPPGKMASGERANCAPQVHRRGLRGAKKSASPSTAPGAWIFPLGRHRICAP